jgi:hypothetical protein
MVLRLSAGVLATARTTVRVAVTVTPLAASYVYDDTVGDDPSSV